MRKLSFCCLIMLSFFACRSIQTRDNLGTVPPENSRHVIAIFMDGTRDKLYEAPDAAKRSHVQSTYLLVRDEIKAFYIEGVGAGNRLVQATKAGTTDKRIMRAYRFLTEQYRDKDSICMFGFSRGANQCRILAGIIHTIGIIDISKVKEEDKEPLLLKLYDAYVDTLDAQERKARLAKLITTWNDQHGQDTIGWDPSHNIHIEFMGLWDTVEAFDVLDKKETPVPVPHHLNQLYNVKKLFHAVSLDDHRAFNYTPILATHKDVLLHPWQNINDIVDEVWFSGTHKNVGGGYKKNPLFNAITLNWMLRNAQSYQLFKTDSVPYHITGTIKDMRRGANRITAPLGDSLRGLDKYWQAMHPQWNDHRVRIHQTVIDRLAAGMVPDFKSKNAYWYDWFPFNQCFKKGNGDTLVYVKDSCRYIQVVR